MHSVLIHDVLHILDPLHTKLALFHIGMRFLLLEIAQFLLNVMHMLLPYLIKVEVDV